MLSAQGHLGLRQHWGGGAGAVVCAAAPGAARGGGGGRGAVGGGSGSRAGAAVVGQRTKKPLLALVVELRLQPLADLLRQALVLLIQVTLQLSLEQGELLINVL